MMNFDEVRQCPYCKSIYPISVKKKYYLQHVRKCKTTTEEHDSKVQVAGDSESKAQLGEKTSLEGDSVKFQVITAFMSKHIISISSEHFRG